MDMNGMPIDGFPSPNTPLAWGGLPIRSGAEGSLLQGDLLGAPGFGDRITESEKERIILECRDAADDEEVQDILDHEVPGGDRALLGDDAAIFPSDRDAEGDTFR